MARYIALLRGVNVGGINITMAPLRAAVEALGHGHVRSVLASGNVLFTSDRTDVGALKAEFEAMLRARFGYDAWIVLTDADALREVVAGYPFDPDPPDRQPYVLFSSKPPVLAELAALSDTMDPAVERIAAGHGVIYWEVQRGQTVRSAFGKATARARFKSSTTTRNLRTLHKLLA
ncbi:DUF1697 domain-containing protein [Tomitella biformata]|uniref:DUF1697 domain-containing protein n=1 Tax=Tomitella biformata TaxID=630403 RepID=UPI000464BB1D|nr:DUF1697 domain-containing protein [Tomitella biformata]